MSKEQTEKIKALSLVDTSKRSTGHIFTSSVGIFY